jgi:membrane associated rhomboid family serine protease
VTTLTPIVRLLLISWAGLWVLGFLVQLGAEPLAYSLGFSPAGVLDGQIGSILGFAVYPFLHDSSSLWHVAINCLLLYYLGPEVERLNPGTRFVRLLITASIAGAALRFVLYLMTGDFAGPVVGGSGLVSCCFAFLAVVMPGIRVSLLVITVRLLPLFLVLTGLDLLRLIATFAGQPSGVAAEIHLAGALVGWTAAGGWERFPLLAGMRDKAAQKRAEKAQQGALADEAELDRILAKISREGIGSLSAREKKFLEQRSKR